MDGWEEMATYNHAQSSELETAIRKVLQADLGEISLVILRYLEKEYGIDLRSPEEVSLEELEDALCDILGNVGHIILDHICDELKVLPTS